MVKKNVQVKIKFCIVTLLVAVMLCAILGAVFNGNQKAEGATANAGYNNVDELIVNNRFNETNLKSLYRYLSGTDTYESVKKKAQDKATANASSTSVYQIVKASEFFSRTTTVASDKNKDILVDFGGFTWTATALTLANNTDYFDSDGNATDAACNVKQGDVILTLMLSAPTDTAVFNTYYNTSTTVAYPSTIYATSELRNITFNAGGYYTTDGTNTTQASQSSSNKYAKFTMPSATGSLTDFIVQPKYVKYQAQENWKDNGNSSSTTCPNEAYVYDSTKSYNNSAETFCKNARHGDWKDDYIWAPSLAEGAAQNTVEPKHDLIWGLSTTQVFTGKTYWLRCSPALGNNGGIEHTMIGATTTQNTSGWTTTNTNASNIYVRPCLHLNLTKAQENIVALPQELTVEYDGADKEIKDADDLASKTWYKDSFFGDPSKVKIEYLLDGVNLTDTGKKPIDAGTYTVRYTILDTKRYAWIDSTGLSDDTRTADFVIRKKPLDLPSIWNNETSKEYKGGNDITFTLESYDKNVLDIKFKDNLIPNNNNISVTDVDKYQLNATLKDTKNYKLTSNKTTIDFEVVPATVKFKITEKVGGSNDLSIFKGDVKDFNLEILVDYEVHVNPDNPVTVPITIIAEATGLTTLTISQVLNLTDYQTFYTITLDASDLVETMYTLKAETTNSSYKVEISPVSTLEVADPSTSTAVRWQLLSDGVPEAGKYKNAEIGETSVALPESMLPTYTGNQYSFRVTYPTATYKLDNTFGYEITPVNASNTAVGKNVDEYTTKIRLEEIATGNKTDYQITWEIKKAKFDLSNVKWVNDGKIPYTGDTVYAELENIPEGLKATYAPGTNDGKDVGDGSTASVTFEVVGDFIGNYEEPSQGGKDTNYIFNGSDDFEWSKDWEVVKAEIAVGKDTDWTTKDYTDDDGNTYKIPALKDKNADDDVVDYVYYETDSHGNIKEGATPIELEDIEYSITDRKYYRAYPRIKDTKNYTFPNIAEDKMYSPFFSIGGGATAVTVALKNNKMEYNGKPRGVSLVSSGGAKASDFDLTYYSGDVIDDDHKLDGAPTEQGNYTVVVKSNKNSIVLNGADNDGNVYLTFEIIAATIKKDWNKNAKPYVLNLKYGQIDGIEYELADAEGNPVSYNDLAPGNTYQIKAKIKDNMQGNYSFTDGTYETSWETFELRAEDIPAMQDPNDPSNIHYPQGEEDDDPSNPNDTTPSGAPSGDGGNGGGTLDEILDKLKDIPLWQLIASVISIILIIAFLSKTASYEGERKKFNKKADKMESSVYAAAFLGLAVSGWTAIACVLMALAVVSLVIMLIAKSRRNKAAEEYEEKKEEYDRNKAEMMYMRMMGNNGGMGQGMPQGAYAYAPQPGIGYEEMRGLISETVTAMLPGVQQMLPQQASYNDELMEQLLKKTAENEDTMQKLMKQIVEQPAERVVEREVAAAKSDDVTIKKLMERSEKNDERIEQLMKNQEALIAKLLEKDNAPQVQVIEKEVPVEKIVEKVVEVPVEKVVEKIVEKEVKVVAPAKPKKEVAPRLTLDEAYKLLSKQQQKYFDGLRQYALSKPNSKEKTSTYAITIGQSTVNPLLKLTIKKDMTVALFKMEDEYLKDIKRDASGDGTKIKVKETEVVISDAQACKAAKNMIDLREDQIERYQDLLKEQRSMSKQRK